MYVGNIESVKTETVDMAGAINAQIQWLITKKEGAENFALRRFILQKGGFIPVHQHPWEHEIFIIQGKGLVGAGQTQKELKSGDFAYIEPDIPHWYKNNGEEAWIFLCAIPYKK